MNCYCSVDDLKGLLTITTVDAARDLRLLDLIEAASREIDEYCKRHFYTETGVRYFDTMSGKSDCLLVDDLLSVSAFGTDEERDGTYDGEAWVEGTDYWLWPWNKWPKEEVRLHPDGNYTFARALERYVKITGVWGYGDGISASPWEATGINASVATADGTTLTLSASGTHQGWTALVGTEQMFVSAVASNGLSATVERGVNGTTAAAHGDAVAMSRAMYPGNVWRFCLNLATALWLTRDMQGFEAESKGEHNYRRLQDWEKFKGNALGRLRKS